MKKRVLLIFASILFVLLLVCLISAVNSVSTLCVTYYELTAPVDKPLRLVQLSDLHSHQFGEENRELIERVAELKPDLVFLTGDMINEDEEKIEVLLSLIDELKEIAPVYFSYGNQEKQWEMNFAQELRPMLEQAGSKVVDTEYVDICLCSAELRIGGYANYYRDPKMLTNDIECIASEMQFADDFENTERYKILLSHIPTPWLEWGRRNRTPVDLVFCGHYHGGLIRFPWDGGLYAPYVGFFPKYTKGMFVGETTTVILSAGLGSNRWRPRINNPAEIVCVDLLPQS